MTAIGNFHQVHDATRPMNLLFHPHYRGRRGLSMSVAEHNRHAWDREAEARNPATVPYSDALMKDALAGHAELTLTGIRLVPKSWYGDLAGKHVLCVALGGGQQVPSIAAAGAKVISVDNSPRQLQADLDQAERYGLGISTHLLNMEELANLNLPAFDIAFLGLGLQFIEDPKPVWRAFAKRLRINGVLVGAIVNPVQYLCEWPNYERGQLNIRHPLPYSDIGSLTDEERSARFDPSDPIEFGHTLEQTFGGVMEAGFSLDHLIEDFAPEDPLAQYMASYYCFCATKRH
jgi:2-polyprenyl-3-methyl-5-hydroxy-6-metoxy-1,4-benzoquinol methylase